MRITDRFIDNNTFVLYNSNIYLLKRIKNKLISKQDYCLVYCHDEDFYTESFYVNSKLDKVLSYSYTQDELDLMKSNMGLLYYRSAFILSHGFNHVYGVHSIGYPRKVFIELLEKRFKR